MIIPTENRVDSEKSNVVVDNERPSSSKAHVRTVRSENADTVPNALQELEKKNELNNIEQTPVASANVQNQDSAVAGTDAPKELISRSSIEEIIQSFTSLSFMALGVRQIDPIGHSELLQILSASDEFVLGETESVEMFYHVWFDTPNRTYYVVRDPRHFIKWTKLSEYFAERLKLLERRMLKSLNVLREPQRVYIDSIRVCDPEALGYPSKTLLDGRSSDQVFRDALRVACRSVMINDSIIEVRCLGDTAVHRATSNLIAFSRSEMYEERMNRSAFLSRVAELERKVKETVAELSGFDWYYPSFSPFMHQGIFDGFRKEAVFRIHFSQPIVMPRVRYTPMASSILLKNASVSVTRVTCVTDIINRSWKPDYAHQLWTYTLSLMMPGEVFIHCPFPDSSVDVAVKGFAALLMRLMLMYDEHSIFSNSSRETQQSIDRAIIAWGVHVDILDVLDDRLISEFPLINYRLRKGSAQDQRSFDFLKIQNGMGGMCSGGCAYAKPVESLREFYPNICVRHNYAVDADDYMNIRDSSLYMNRWRVYRGAISFLSASTSLAQYKTLFNSYGKNIIEFIIRVNEFLKVSWYNIFRMTSTRSASFYGAYAQGLSPSVDFGEIDFFLVAAKGLDTAQLIPERTTLARIRYQGSFAKEAFRVDMRMKHIDRLWADAGRLKSFPKRRRIQMACEDSTIFAWIRSELFASNEDRRIGILFDRFNFDLNGLARAFNPLLETDPRLERMYGIVGGVFANARLNFIGRDLIMNAIIDRSPLCNVVDHANDAIAYSYRDIEMFVRARRFNSMFYASTSVPFVLNVRFPYEMHYALASSENCVSLSCKPNISSDVSFEHHVSNSSIKILLLSVDQRDYQYEDDFVVSTHRVDEVFPIASDVSDIIVPANEFFTTLNLRSCRVHALTKKDFKFISIYSLNTACDH